VYAQPSTNVLLSAKAEIVNILEMQVFDSSGPTQCLLVATTSSIEEFSLMKIAALFVPLVIDQGCS
jgi:hypothetical protein